MDNDDGFAMFLTFVSSLLGLAIGLIIGKFVFHLF